MADPPRFNDNGQELCRSCGKPLSPYWRTKCQHCGAPFQRERPAPPPRSTGRVLLAVAAVLVLWIPGSMYVAGVCVYVIERGGPLRPLDVAFLLPPILVVLLFRWAFRRFPR